MRRDDGCGERGAGLADGRQGRDPGDTFDADGLRPLHDKLAVGRTDAPGVYEDSIRPSDCVLSIRGPTGRGSSGGSLCGDGLTRPNRASQAECAGHPVWLVSGDARLRACP